MGGPSSEYEVSLDGGRHIVDAIDPGRFDVRPVVISRDGQWHVSPRRRGGREGCFNPRDIEGWRRFGGPLEALCHLVDLRVDVVFPILHGRFGEDGTVQACLTAAGLPFVGSGSAASALAMDKVRTKEVLGFHGILTPAFEELSGAVLTRGIARTADGLVARYGTPLVLKDPRGGSSLEVRIADDPREVAAAIQDLVPPAKRLMVEEYVAGRELTAGVIRDRERGEATALPIVEIRPRHTRSFDYREKYDPDGAEELCPAPISEELEGEARRLGLAVHRILGLSGISRTDIILDEEERLQVLEVNTIPGMTQRSLIPRAAGAAGMSFSALVDNLIRTAGEV